MNLLRLITFAVVVFVIGGCSTTTTVKFDDHLRYDENFRPIITKTPRITGVKIQQSSTVRIAPKLRELYKRKKLDVRLEDNILAFEEIINSQTVNQLMVGSIVLKVGNLFEKIFTNNNDSKFLLSIKETKLTMGGVNLGSPDLSGTYLIIATLSNGDKTEIIKIKQDYRFHSLRMIGGLKDCIEDAIDELYSVVKVNLNVWENN